MRFTAQAIAANERGPSGSPSTYADLNGDHQDSTRWNRLTDTHHTHEWDVHHARHRADRRCSGLTEGPPNGEATNEQATRLAADGRAREAQPLSDLTLTINDPARSKETMSCLVARRAVPARQLRGRPSTVCGREQGERHDAAACKRDCNPPRGHHRTDHRLGGHGRLAHELTEAGLRCRSRSSAPCTQTQSDDAPGTRRGHRTRSDRGCGHPSCWPGSVAGPR